MQKRNATLGSPGKQAAGEAAARLVDDGSVIGLGTGSTTAFAIKAIGRRIDEGIDVLAVVTSYQSEMLAIEAGIPLTTLAEHPELDITIDGADQVDADLNVIKGGGAAHTKEKVVAFSSDQFVVVVDGSKMKEQLDHFVPIEVLPYAKELVMRCVHELGGEPRLRLASQKDGPVITDNGNFVIDAAFGTIDNVEALSISLSMCPGVVEHGIFIDVVDAVFIGNTDGSVKRLDTL
ncbi:ribose-5-phosphate isomerase RpiA [Methanomethylovorans sp.]|uniref:ribose-5-phosphate isomerase RpiA n=1 Tax=Methanomethylovorans sp. TaxID=2758717 RepID=UPI00345E0B71